MRYRTVSKLSWRETTTGASSTITTRRWRYWGDVVYLQDNAFTIRGLSLWGSPWQPEDKNGAFNLPGLCTP